MMKISQFSADPGQGNSLAINPPQLDDFCRICLLQKSTLHSLTSQLTPVMIPEMLYKITGTTLNMQEPMPRVICDRCLGKLDLAYNIAEEFRKQEATLRRFWWKGGLVDQLVEYQGTEESQRKFYSEEVLERLAGERVVPSDLADLEEEFGMDEAEAFLPVEEVEPLDAAAFTIKVLPDEAFDELAEELLSPEPDEGVNDVIDNGLEMVLELVDLRTIGALPADVEEQLLEQEVLGGSSDESDVDYVPSPEDFGARIDSNKALEEESDNVDEDDDRDEDFYPIKNPKKSRRVEEFPDLSNGRNDNIQLGNEQNVFDVDFSTKITISTKDYWFQKGSFKCPECSETFKTRFSLRRHYRRHVIVQKGNVQCELPRKPKQGPLKTKSNVYTDARCKYCQRLFRYRGEQRKHERKHEEYENAKGEESNYVHCGECDTLFQTAEHYEIHHKRVHLKSAVIATEGLCCADCDVTFSTNSEYRGHMRRHDNIIYTMFKCGICKLAFDAYHTLANHYLFVHNVDFKPSKTKKCKICERQVAISTFNDHVSSHKRKQALQFFCHLCNKTFNSSRSMKKHRAARTCERTKRKLSVFQLTEPRQDGTYKCKECGRVFRSYSSAYNHIAVHQNVKEGRYKCEPCARIFPSKWDLKNHNMRHFHEQASQDAELQSALQDQ